jgi:uncharacterized membrane protein YfcA
MKRLKHLTGTLVVIATFAVGMTICICLLIPYMKMGTEEWQRTAPLGHLMIFGGILGVALLTALAAKIVGLIPTKPK